MTLSFVRVILQEVFGSETGLLVSLTLGSVVSFAQFRDRAISCL